MVEHERIVHLASYGLVASLRVVYGQLYEIAITEKTLDGARVRTEVMHAKGGTFSARNQFHDFLNVEYPKKDH